MREEIVANARFLSEVYVKIFAKPRFFNISKEFCRSGILGGRAGREAHGAYK